MIVSPVIIADVFAEAAGRDFEIEMILRKEFHISYQIGMYYALRFCGVMRNCKIDTRRICRAIPVA